MPIPFECTGCGKKLRVKDESAGKRIKCPGCQAVVTVPKPQSAGGEDDFLGGLDDAVKQVKKRPRAVIEDDDDDEDEDVDEAPGAPKRRSKKTSSKRSSSSGSTGRILAGIGGGVVALAVFIGLIVKLAPLAQNGGFMNQKVTWQQFRHPTGASIDMPGLATFNVKASTNPNAQVYTCNSRNFACSLTAAPIPAVPNTKLNNNLGSVEAIFLEIKSELFFKPGISQISDTRVEHGTMRGMELQMEVNGLMNVSRFFVTDSHLIACEIVFKKGREPVAEREHFFKSLQLTGAPVGGATPMPGMPSPNPMR